jgi:ferrous iron transport protein B
VALIGNPNAGKTSLFNALTGLNQQIGNFPGITVDKKVGFFQLNDGTQIKILDLPGTYSLFPKSIDEKVAVSVLCDNKHEDFPDVTIVIADASNLKRSLFLCSQVIDLKIPVVVALTMTDLAKKRGISVDADRLAREMGVPVVVVNARTGKGVDQLKSTVSISLNNSNRGQDFYNIIDLAEGAITEVKQLIPSLSNYGAVHHLINHESFNLSVDECI